ncbi:MAG: cation:proton antiporter [Candidatus Eremiobacterota bacterium]
MPPEHVLFTRSLVLLALGAFGIPLLCRPLRIPAAVGEILYGILVGPYVLGLVQVGPFVSVLAELGFYLLMFLAGLELDFSELERRGREMLGASLMAAGALFGLSVAATWLMGWPVFLFMVVGATSIGVSVVLLAETGLSRERTGQVVLLLGSVGEFGCILIATGANAYAESGFGAAFLISLLQLGGVFLLAYLSLVVLRTWVWWRPEAFSRLVESHDPSEIGVRAGLAIMFIFVAVTTSLGLEPILGAFLAGVLFSFAFRHKGPLEMKFMSLGNGFFIPLFFITVGLRFNLPMALSGNFLLFLQLMAALFLVRLLPCLVFRPPGQSWRDGVCVALGLSAPLTLLVLFANLGLSMGELDEGMHASIIMLAMATALVFPFLFKLWVRVLPTGTAP